MKFLCHTYNVNIPEDNNLMKTKDLNIFVYIPICIITSYFAPYYCTYRGLNKSV